MRSLIFINCGGRLDLTQLWFYSDALPEVQCFLFDSHRPFNHNNIIDPLKRLNIIHDGCGSFDKYPTAEDIQILQEFADDDEEEDEEDDEFDSEKEEAKEELDDLKDGDSEEDVYGGDRVAKKKAGDEEEEDEGDIVGADEDLEEVRVG